MAKQGGSASGRGRGVFVGPHDDGWQVKRSGKARASVVTETQAEAIKIARRYAQEDGTELVVQNRKGQIREKDSQGDESPAKDKD
jgi:hypothetical protein